MVFVIAKEVKRNLFLLEIKPVSSKQPMKCMPCPPDGGVWPCISLREELIWGAPKREMLTSWSQSIPIGGPPLGTAPLICVALAPEVGDHESLAFGGFSLFQMVEDLAVFILGLDLALVREALGKAGKIGISVYCGGQGGDQGTRALVSNLYGATIANKTNTRYTMNSPEGAKALELLKDLEKKGYIDAGLSIAAADELQLFAQQQIASTICWGTSNALNYATDAFTQVSVPFPSNDSVPSLEYLVNGFCVFDNKDAGRAEAAKKLIQFICDDPEWGKVNVVKTGAFPVRSSFGDLYPGNPEYALLASWTKYYGGYYNTMPGFAAMRTEWWNMLQYVFTGDKTVAKALADYDVNSNAVFK